MSLVRTKLTTRKGESFTPDTLAALEAVERSAPVDGKRTSTRVMALAAGDLPEAVVPLREAGRVVTLQWLDMNATPDEKLAELWGRALPAGFMAWNRFPVPSAFDYVFFFVGPWQGLIDSLLSEGRGHLAWPSFVAAALVDVGKWEGDRTTERFVQAQLHRIGMPCGPIDGIIGERTAGVLRALGVDVPMEKAAEILAGYEPKAPAKEERKFGHLVLPGVEFVVTTTGRISPIKQPNGSALAIDGPGRIVVDVR